MKTQFKTWKKVTIGNGLKSFDDFNQALMAKKITIDDPKEIEEMIKDPSFEVFKDPTEIELIMVEFWDRDELGVNTCNISTSRINILIEDLILRARNVGLEECPPETALQLRLQHLHEYPQPGGVTIGMNPLAGRIFKVYKREIPPDYSDWSSDERPMLTSEETRQRTKYIDSIGMRSASEYCYYLSRYVFMKPIRK